MASSHISLIDALTIERSHPRGRRLITVARLQQQQLRQSQQRCVDLQQRLQQEQQQGQQLQNYRDEYQTQLAQPDQQSVSAEILHHKVYFIQQINQSLTSQQVRIEELKEQVKLAQQHFSESQMKAKGLVDLMDKLDQQWHQQQQKLEQRQSDEWSNQQFSRRNS